MGILDDYWGFIAGIVILVLFFIWKRLQRSSPAVVREKLDNNALVVDVRSKIEFKGGHFPGAINIPLENLSKQVNQLGKKSNSLILYCASGARSGMAKSMLSKAGFEDVINAGGLYHMMAHK